MENPTESRSGSGAAVPGKFRSRSEGISSQVDCSQPSQSRSRSEDVRQISRASKSRIRPLRLSSTNSA